MKSTEMPRNFTKDGRILRPRVSFDTAISTSINYTGQIDIPSSRFKK